MTSMIQKREHFFLVIILIAALGVRLTFWKYWYLYGVDPYYHYNNYSVLVENGHHLLPLGLYSPALLVNSTLRIFSVSAYDSFRLSVPIFGVLTVYAVYLITKEVFNKKTALISGAVLAFTPIFIIRTLASNYRGDPFSMFFVVIAFYFFLIYFKDNNKGLKAYLFLLLGGLSLALSGAVWSSGYIFSGIVISAFAIICSLLSFVKGEKDIEGLIGYLIIIGSSILFLFSFDFLGVLQQGLPKISGFSDFYLYIFPLVIILLVLVEGLKSPFGNWGENRRLYLIMLSGLTLLLLIFFQNPDIIFEVLNLYKGHYISKLGSLGTTGELAPFSFSLYVDKFRFVGFLFPIGLIFFLKGRNFSRENIFLLLWLMGACYVMVKIGQRGTFVASIPVSIFAGFGIVSFFKTIKGLKPLPRNLRKGISGLLTVFLLIIIVVQGVGTTTEIKPLINDNWYDALSWQKENLPPDSVVLSWWSYGYWISGIGGGKTIVNPGQDQEKIRQVADIFFEENKTSVENYLKNNRIDYVIVSSDFIGIASVIKTIRNSTEPSYAILLPRTPTNVRGEILENFGDILLVKTFDTGEMSAIISKDKMYLSKIYYRNDGQIQQNDPYISNKPVDESGSFYLSYGDLFIPEIKIGELYYYNVETYGVFIPREMEDKLLTSLLFKDGIGFQGLFIPVYANNQVKIFQVNYSN